MHLRFLANTQMELNPDTRDLAKKQLESAWRKTRKKINEAFGDTALHCVGPCNIKGFCRTSYIPEILEAGQIKELIEDAGFAIYFNRKGEYITEREPGYVEARLYGEEVVVCYHQGAPEAAAT